MIYLVSRHPGAIEWCSRQGFHIDITLAHLEPERICQGDILIGTLPVPVVAQIQQRGCRYLHISLPLTESLRGKELSADQMEQLGTSLAEFQVVTLNS